MANLVTPVELRGTGRGTTPAPERSGDRRYARGLELFRARSRAIRRELRDWPSARGPQLPSVCGAARQYGLSFASQPGHRVSLPQSHHGCGLASAAGMRGARCKHQLHDAHSSWVISSFPRQPHKGCWRRFRLSIHLESNRSEATRTFEFSLHAQDHSKSNRPRGVAGAGREGATVGCVLLTRQKKLCEASRVNVAEERRSRRQQGRRQELRIKGVAAGWRRIDRSAALVSTKCLPVVIHADDGAAIIQSLARDRNSCNGPAAPVFDIAEEVVDSAVGTEVGGGTGRLREGDAFASHNSSPVIGTIRGAVGGDTRDGSSGVRIREGKGIDVVKAVRQKRDSVRVYGDGDVRVVKAAIGGIGIEVSLDVCRILRGNGQAARHSA